ncbi:MAG: threonine/serine exporter family protein, partial [Muribaculaceae bacterium]|nr:threonine/serine exporter family protein [Muribaculaceae bacterium]
YKWCALIAAVGHSTRYLLMNLGVAPMHIIPATLIASFVIGTLAVFIASYAKFPAETCIFPALLPMIPGIYAYKAFAGLALCVFSSQEGMFDHDFYLWMSNGLTCGVILLCMVVGGTLPLFIFKRIAFQSTR